MKCFSVFLLLTSIPIVTAQLGTCCGLFSNPGSKCCNFFFCQCHGPCWNRGCYTTCQEGKYPGLPVSCPGNNEHYNCCPTGSSCKPSSSCSPGTQNHCCCDINNKQIVSIDAVTYDFDGARQFPSSALVVASKYKGTNSSPVAKDVGKIKVSATHTQTTSWSFDASITISASATVEAGVPYFGEGELTAGVETTFAYGQSKSEQVDLNIDIDPGNDKVPPFSYQSYQFDAKMFSFRIPFKAQASIKDDCGGTGKQEVRGTALLDGTATFANGEWSKIIGPAVPIECNKPFDTPIREQRNTNFCSTGSIYCEDHALCVRFGFTGVCCENNKMSPCCSYAVAHPPCIKAGFDPNRVLCPSPPGNFQDCCLGRGEASSTGSDEAADGGFHYDIEYFYEMTKEQKQAQDEADKHACIPRDELDSQDVEIVEEFVPFDRMTTATECNIEEEEKEDEEEETSVHSATMSLMGDNNNNGEKQNAVVVLSAMVLVSVGFIVRNKYTASISSNQYEPIN